MELLFDVATVVAVVSTAVSMAWYVRGLQARVERLERWAADVIVETSEKEEEP